MNKWIIYTKNTRLFSGMKLEPIGRTVKVKYNTHKFFVGRCGKICGYAFNLFNEPLYKVIFPDCTIFTFLPKNVEILNT